MTDLIHESSQPRALALKFKRSAYASVNALTRLADVLSGILFAIPKLFFQYHFMRGQAMRNINPRVLKEERVRKLIRREAASLSDAPPILAEIQIRSESATRQRVWAEYTTSRNWKLCNTGYDFNASKTGMEMVVEQIHLVLPGPIQTNCWETAFYMAGLVNATPDIRSWPGSIEGSGGGTLPHLTPRDLSWSASR